MRYFYYYYDCILKLLGCNGSFFLACLIFCLHLAVFVVFFQPTAEVRRRKEFLGWNSSEPTEHYSEGKWYSTIPYPVSMSVPARRCRQAKRRRNCADWANKIDECERKSIFHFYGTLGGGKNDCRSVWVPIEVCSICLCLAKCIQIIFRGTAADRLPELNCSA